MSSSSLWALKSEFYLGKQQLTISHLHRERTKSLNLAAAAKSRQSCPIFVNEGAEQPDPATCSRFIQMWAAPYTPCWGGQPACLVAPACAAPCTQPGGEDVRVPTPSAGPQQLSPP